MQHGDIGGTRSVTDRFHAYAVPSRWGPHVTMQAGVMHLGRHWTTATRRSVKAVAVRRSGWASASLPGPDGVWRVVGGRAAVLDGTRPWTLLGEPVHWALAGGAVARLAASHAGQLVGYSELAGAVPAEFLPWGRVLLVIGADDDLTVDAPEDHRASRNSRRPSRDSRRARPLPRTRDPLPAPVAALARVEGPCLLGVDTGRGPVALPGRWHPETGLALVPAAALAAVGAEMPGRACITLHDSRSHRPDRKVGIMLRGWARVAGHDGSEAGVAVAAERITHWSGFGAASSPVRAARG